MKSMARFLALALIVFLVGCATTQTGGGTAPSASAPSSDNKMLTDDDYKRLGIQEVDRK
jgi:uncharacterized lipoprotein YajG